MRIRNFIAGNRRSEALREIDHLIVDLQECSRTAARKGLPGLVDLETSIQRAERLRTLLQGSIMDWESVLRLILLLSKIVEKIHAIINCNFSQERSYESWVYHKDAENLEGNLADLIGAIPRCDTFVLITDREWPMCTKPALLADSRSRAQCPFGLTVCG